MEFANKKQLVKKVQESLSLDADGIAGKNTWAAIGSKLGVGSSIAGVQAALGLGADGIDGPATWNAIIAKISATVNDQITDSVTQCKPIIGRLSEKALKLILEFEVGGGKGYYEKCLKHPTWPAGQSGVTIGIGYDLGYNDLSQFKGDWQDKLSAGDFERLTKTLGKKSGIAKAAVGAVKDISIPWDAALEVFQTNTVPRFIKTTLQAFPNADKLHPDAFGALVSLVFNRGGSVSGESRREMLNIRNLIASQDYKAIAKEIKDMKRLWVGKGLDGLLTRRNEEAALIESCA